MWRKNIEDTKMKVSRKGLLEEAYYYYKRLEEDYNIPRILSFKVITDKYGKIGFDCGGFILVAKLAPYGDIVSMNRKIWRRGKIIVMYLKSSRNFYVFKPEEIKEVVENRCGDSVMVNFDIKCGVNVKMGKEKSEEEKQRYLAENV